MTTEELIGQFGYFGIILLLVLGGLGLPMPEEAPIVLAAILTKHAKMNGVLAFGSCLLGVLAGDFVVYFLGYWYGERVLSFRLTRTLLTKEREEQLKGYFHRHGFKILIVGRFAVGFRTAAYLTAGILRLPALRLLLTDLVAALLSTSLMFALGYVFAHQIEAVIQGAQHWFVVIVAAAVAAAMLYRYVQARKRAGLPVGPKILIETDLPLPPDDLHPPNRSAQSPDKPPATPEPNAAEAVPASTTPTEPAVTPDPPTEAPALDTGSRPLVRERAP